MWPDLRAEQDVTCAFWWFGGLDSGCGGGVWDFGWAGLRKGSRSVYVIVEFDSEGMGGMYPVCWLVVRAVILAEGLGRV